MEIAILIVTLVLGAVLGAWYTVFLKRPKLKIVGSGGGGGQGPGFHQNHVRVANQPGFLGIRLSPTVILGKRIHGSVEKGLTVERNSANECRASIIDKQTGQHITLLWWRLTNGDPQFHQSVTLGSGESADLMLFARLDSEPTKYFVFAPGIESDGSPRVPDDGAKFDDTREFLMRIDYSYGRQKLTFRGTIRKGFDGRLSWESDGGGGSF